MRFSVLHPGTQYALRVAEALSAHDQLIEFWTGIGLSRSSTCFRLVESLSPRVSVALENRISSVLPPSQVRCIPLPEVFLLLKQRWGSAKYEDYMRRNRVFQESIPQSVVRNSDGLVGYDTSSWILAERCRRAGKPFVLDRSIGHYNAKERIFEKLRMRYPDWQASIPKASIAGNENETREHELASVIVVPSRFVAETLVAEGINPSKIVPITFGTDTNFFSPPADNRSIEQLRFLFVGGLSSRKGVPDLVEAWRRASLDKAELWIVGFGEVPLSFKRNLPKNVVFHGKLSRRDVASRMREANALLFPSHFEGLAQVQVEALASGLPVIATHESGASDIVKPNVNGLIVDAGNVEQLAAVLKTLDKNRNMLSDWERNLRNAKQDLSWEEYGKTWIREVPKLL